MNKKQLALLLSKIKFFEEPDLSLEQYQTDPEIAAEALWFVNMQNDIKGKVIADLGCGTGIFGFGALILGAKKIYFVDVDKGAINLAKENKKILEKKLNKKFNAVFVNKNIKNYNYKVDVVIQNPPFGVKRTHTDKLFLMKAMETAPVIYSFHKLESKDFIKRFVEENNFKIKNLIEMRFPLKARFKFHRKKTYFVDVGFWRITK
jgi:putative methylase